MRAMAAVLVLVASSAGVALADGWTCQGYCSAVRNVDTDATWSPNPPVVLKTGTGSTAATAFASALELCPVARDGYTSQLAVAVPTPRPIDRYWIGATVSNACVKD